MLARKTRICALCVSYHKGRCRLGPPVVVEKVEGKIIWDIPPVLGNATCRYWEGDDEEENDDDPGIMRTVGQDDDDDTPESDEADA